MSKDEQSAIGELLEQVAAELSDMVIGVSADGGMYYVSPSVEGVLGYSDRVFQRLYNHAVNYKDDQRFLGIQRFVFRQLDKLKAEMVTGLACEPETLAVNHRDGFRVSLSVQCMPSVDSEGELRGAVCICRDISARKHQLDEVALAKVLFENTMMAVYVTNAAGKIIQANATFSRLSGYQQSEVLGCSPELIDVKRYSPEFLGSIKDHLARHDSWEGELQHRHKDGHVFSAWVTITVLRDKSGHIANTVCYFSDLTEIKRREEKIQRLAYYDSLTGLPNRSLFVDRLSQALEHARRERGEVALLLLDMDDFKSVNDAVGHALGDALLHQIGDKICSCVRREDTVARMGGDEFAVILGGLSAKGQARILGAAMAEKIRAALAEPFFLRGYEFLNGASVGVACFPHDGRDTTTLLQRADSSLFQAKQRVEGNRRLIFRGKKSPGGFGS